MALGAIDVIQGNLVHGWFYDDDATVIPALFSDGKPATLVENNVPRPDVAKELGVRPDTGYIFRLPYTKETKTLTLTLFAASPKQVLQVTSKEFSITCCNQHFLQQIERAAHIARQPNAVGITLWDGAHNPLGRAKVLYDVVVSSGRPCVILCYLHREFGNELWPPLANSNIPLVAIPWERRSFCHALLQQANVRFDTLWICKPRLPSFYLASVVSGPATRLVLDIDDDEEAFMLSQTDPTDYNLPGQGLATELIRCVSAHTVVSPPLQRRYGGEQVRHVRRQERNTPPHSSQEVPKKVAFLGTVRKHKGLLPLAKALRDITASTGTAIQFYVYGDIREPNYRELLTENGVIVSDIIPMGDLAQTLAEMDAVITSYPVDEALTQRITEYQVPAKISDALSVGLPVLTPDTPSIADIRTIPGIYPFTLENFKDQLLAALHHSTSISLPEDFTPTGAYKAFAQAEQKAESASVLRDLMPVAAYQDSPPTLLLLWKQYDAGLYGRRVDQLARSYARAYPDYRVIVLELYNETLSQKDEEIQPEFYTDETSLRDAFLAKKRYGFQQDGVLYQALFYTDDISLRNTFLDFLEVRNLTPKILK